MNQRDNFTTRPSVRALTNVSLPQDKPHFKDLEGLEAIIVNAFDRGGIAQETIYGLNGTPLAHEALARPAHGAKNYPIYDLCLQFYGQGHAREFDIVTGALALRNAKKLPVTVNISVESALCDKQFWPEMLKRLNGQQTDSIDHHPKDVIFEILEHDVDPQTADIKHLEALKEQGYRFALDDFSIGADHERRLQVFGELTDYIKIDGPLIRAALDNTGNQDMDNLVELIQGLKQRAPHAKIVAEHVDNPLEAETLFRLGFDGVQGRNLRDEDFAVSKELSDPLPA